MLFFQLRLLFTHWRSNFLLSSCFLLFSSSFHPRDPPRLDLKPRENSPSRHHFAHPCLSDAFPKFRIASRLTPKRFLLLTANTNFFVLSIAKSCQKRVGNPLLWKIKCPLTSRWAVSRVKLKPTSCLWTFFTTWWSNQSPTSFFSHSKFFAGAQSFPSPSPPPTPSHYKYSIPRPLASLGRCPSSSTSSPCLNPQRPVPLSPSPPRPQAGQPDSDLCLPVLRARETNEPSYPYPYPAHSKFLQPF